MNIEKIANWKVITPLLLLTLVFLLYIFPCYQPKLTDAYSCNIPLLNARLWYTKCDVEQVLYLLGPNKRASYWFVTARIDMIFPLVYGSFLFLSLYNLSHKFFKRNLRLIYFLPLLAVLFDYIENFGTLILLSDYSSVSDGLVYFNSTATSFKWLFTITSFTLTLVLFCWWVYSLFTKRD